MLLFESFLQDTALVKKNLYYAKLALQADYDTKIERRSLELYVLIASYALLCYIRSFIKAPILKLKYLLTCLS